METLKPQPGFGFDVPAPEPGRDAGPPEVREEPKQDRDVAVPLDGSVFNPVGYANQAAAAWAKIRAAKRAYAKGNADMSHGIMVALHGPTVRSRALIISNVYTPPGAPKVGVVTTAAPEQYAPDGQALNAPAPRWQNGYNADIAGTIGSLTYTPVAGDVGKQLNIAITPSNGCASRHSADHLSDREGRRVKGEP